MAEFQEVCKQWRRMCQSMEDAAAKDYRPCSDLCPVGCNPVCGELCESTQEDIKRFETVIMAWAAEHPEPVYPTWIEWFQSHIWKKGTDVSSMLLYDPIPADIAEKLGLQPKEG